MLGCAESGDEIALAVLRQQGEELAYLVRLVIRRCGLRQPRMIGPLLSLLPAASWKMFARCVMLLSKPCSASFLTSRHLIEAWIPLMEHCGGHEPEVFPKIPGELFLLGKDLRIPRRRQTFPRESIHTEISHCATLRSR